MPELPALPSDRRGVYVIIPRETYDTSFKHRSVSLSFDAYRTPNGNVALVFEGSNLTGTNRIESANASKVARSLYADGAIAGIPSGYTVQRPYEVAGGDPRIAAADRYVADRVHEHNLRVLEHGGYERTSGPGADSPRSSALPAGLADDDGVPPHAGVRPGPTPAHHGGTADAPDGPHRPQPTAPDGHIPHRRR